MFQPASIDHDSHLALALLRPRLEESLANEISTDLDGWNEYIRRLGTHFGLLFQLYSDLYQDRFDFLYQFENLLVSLARSWFRRPAGLRELDIRREQAPAWFLSNQMLGGVIYVDLFAGDLQEVRSKIPYFKELGLTYLHLMPLFKAPEGENDGGYAVSSYREVNPALGNMRQLAALADDLRSAGISLVIDLIFNHTSDQHMWALRARAGDQTYQDFYRMFPDRMMPDAYERTLREIFPDEHPGAFTYFPEIDRWVWTTFHSYQWDLNYANPAVFNRMAEEMLFLANQGVEIIRLDAVAFTWKVMGTSCENLPGAHTLIQAFNAVARIASPALLFKSEAIVHPDDVVKYIDRQECQLSYNPQLMALLWNSLATRDVSLLSQALGTHYRLASGTAWVNYVRCHDDIGWTFSDEAAAGLGIKGYDHRRFLNEFYRGRFPGSFARGLPFQENPKNGDCRISGTCASLAGLEKALHEEGPREVELAIKRICLIHGVILLAGGIPLLYLGDEIGMLNHYSYADDPAKCRDSRWVHRQRADWQAYARRADGESVEGRVYGRLKKLIAMRKDHLVFAGGDLQPIQTGNEHVLGFVRSHAGQQALVLVNFSEVQQTIPGGILDLVPGFPTRKVHGDRGLSLQQYDLEAFLF